MGIVLKAEHISLRQLVAVKVLSLSPGEDEGLLLRFLIEMRVVARLQHPNLVSAIDAGRATSDDPDAPVLHYFVMEFVDGRDLEAYVLDEGRLPIAQACGLVYQIVSALVETHKQDLIHRDIKPANILVAKGGQAKLLDFGLARHLRNRLTEPGAVLGSVDYMAPEQARDASNVDIRADIYGLGGTLYWCLARQAPFPTTSNFTRDFMTRMTQQAPSVRLLRPDVPPALDMVIARMMALSPDDRYATPQAVLRALLPFLGEWNGDLPAASPAARAEPCTVPTQGSLSSVVSGSYVRMNRVLVVDDEEAIRTLCQLTLAAENLECEGVANGLKALEVLALRPFDLILLDIDMPEMSGLEVVRRVRERPPCPNLKIVMFSGRTSTEAMAVLLQAGANDFLHKPFKAVELRARIQAHLDLKKAQDRSDLLNSRLLAMNVELERNLSARDSDLVHARNALVLALAKMTERRHSETAGHLVRMQRYVRCLAEEAACLPPFATLIDTGYIGMLECCAPLHDIGTVGLPDHILLKPGKLTTEERLLMQEHTTMGAETLQEVALRHGSALGFLQMAIDIVRHHHERYDGTGYPDHLTDGSIPLAARIVALADVYDALRSRRAYKPALSHGAALQIMAEGSEGHFDPSLLPVLHSCADHLERIFRECGN
jgi:response regulator RpfG family c-di-GMP phosphodiesterase